MVAREKTTGGGRKRFLDINEKKQNYVWLKLSILLLIAGGIQPDSTAVIGTIKGDLHDIGKNLVGILLKGAGFEVIDLGHDVAPEAFVDAAVREGAPLIGMSALLTTTMTRMRDVVALVEERGLRGKVRTIVGGAPVNADFAREIGADGYACDAAGVIALLESRGFLGWTIGLDASLVPVRWAALQDEPDAIRNVLASRQQVT